MATVDITAVRPNGNSFAEGRLNPPAELWAPPLAPNGTTAAGYVVLREDAIWPEIGGRILSSLLSQVIYPKRLDPAES